MTFSLILRDPATGQFGSAICSSSPAVAARCVNLADGVGAVHSQNVTDPRLGPKVLDRLRLGDSAQDAVATVTTEVAPEILGFRQLLALDRAGHAAVYSGPNALGIFGSIARQDAVAAGNMLARPEVLDALIDTALSASGCLEQRLLVGLRAAVAAGGEAGPVHSAGIAVIGDVGWRITDLRVDWADDDPINELANLVDRWLPERDAYITRGLNPTQAPSYGVPGDE